MIKTTTIKSKLMIAFFCIASLVVVVGVVGIVNSHSIYNSLNFVTNDSLPELLVSSKIQTLANKISSDIVGFAVVSPVTNQLHQERLQQLTEDSRVLTGLVDQLDKIDVGDPKERAKFYPTLRDLTSNYSSVSLQLINSKYDRLDEQSILNLISSTDNLRSKIDTMIDNKISLESAKTQNEIAKANKSLITQQQEIIITSIAACIAALLIGRHISLNSIIKPLLELKQETVQIAHGNYDVVERKKSGARAGSDEIGELSIQFDNMRQMLNQRTGELESSNKQLSLANEQLKINDRAQRDFIKIAAHELRTPIEPLLLGAEQLEHMLPNNEIVSIILRNIKKLQILSSIILDTARIEGGTFKIYKERVNIKDIISDALEVTNCSVSSINNDNNDTFNIVYEAKDIFIDVDKDRITQVISNLLNNAVKSIKDEEQQEKTQGVISIIVQQRENMELVVSITDNGKGIDPEIMPKLFTRFATKSFDGTGLGLYICKSIIEAHGGKIWGQNNSEVKGAKFSFSLPSSSSS